MEMAPSGSGASITAGFERFLLFSHSLDAVLFVQVQQHTVNLSALAHAYGSVVAHLKRYLMEFP